MINYKIVDYINLILRKTDFTTCTADQVIDLRTCMGAVLYSMIEVYGAEGSPALVSSIGLASQLRTIYIYVLK